MIAFLTSSPMIREELRLNPANGFIDSLRNVFPNGGTGLFICSDPDIPEMTDHFSEDVKAVFAIENMTFSEYYVLDGRNSDHADELVKQADFITLAGGHVPTQNQFFQKIGLRGLLQDWNGVLMGISAGTMNCADIVYAQPEEDGEAIDPDYVRFLPGLGLTKTMILPHYQMIRNSVLDGLRVIDDIAVSDSMGRTFTAIPDGSYLYIENGLEKWFGERIIIENGRIY